MIRLMIWGVIFAAGAWVGAEYTRYEVMQACLDADGSVDARGICNGAK